MMNIRILKLASAITVIIGACASCNSVEVLEPTTDSATATVIGTPTNALEGSLLLFVDDSLATAWAATVPSDGSFTEADGLLSELGVEAISRIFPGSDKEVLTKAAGSYKYHRWFKVSFPETESLSAMCSALSALPHVLKVQYNAVVTRPAMPQTVAAGEVLESVATKAVGSNTSTNFNDPGLSYQWYLSNDGSVSRYARAGADINVLDAWRLTAGSPEVIVAVIDDGVWYEHPDLAANIWVNEGEIPGDGIDNDGNGYIDDVHGANFAHDNNSSPIVWDAASGHGTHVAGILGAVNNNGIGICGVAGGKGNNDGIRMMCLQIFEGEAQADYARVAQAIKYAKDMGAVILQCSFGYDPYNGQDVFGGNDAGYKAMAGGVQAEALDDFIQNNTNFAPTLTGGLAIFSVGNNYTGRVNYPAAYTPCIAVTSLGADGLPAIYSNYGYGANIAAPGGELGIGGIPSVPSCSLSTLSEGVSYDTGMRWELDPDKYAYMQGTSQACPLVSGVAALGLAYARQLGKEYSQQEYTSLLLSSVNDLVGSLSGTKVSIGASGRAENMNLSNYVSRQTGASLMGTGCVDAWRLLMAIEGTPCLLAAVDMEQGYSLDEYFGGGSSAITYGRVEVSDEDKAALGLDSDPYIKDGQLFICPTRYGSGKVTVYAVGGGDNVGSDLMQGGQSIYREISIVTRGAAATNGGWL